MVYTCNSSAWEVEQEEQESEAECVGGGEVGQEAGQRTGEGVRSGCGDSQH